MEGALVTFEGAAGIEEAHFVSALVMGTIVGSKDDKGVLLDFELL